MNARVSLMVCAATVFIGVACTSSNANAGAGFFSSSSPQARNAAPLPERPAPNGFNLFRDPQGSARVLYGSFSGNARSATAATQGMLQNLRGYFDDAPEMRTFLRDGADQQAQAFFSGSIARQPVAGIIGVQLAGGGGFVSILFDRPETFATSYARVRNAFIQNLPQGGGGGARPIPPLYPQMLGDGSQISLPQGWRVTSSNKGSVDIEGPAGEGLSLGAWAPVYYQKPYITPPGYVLVGPCCDPVRAMAAIVPQLSRGMQMRGSPGFSIVRVIEAHPTQPVSAGGQAAFILTDLNIGGRASRSFAWVSAAPTGTQWVYYTSGVVAPTENFTAELPTLLAIWKSYSINPAVFRERLDRAAADMKAIAQIRSDVNANRQHASAAAAEGWDQYIRGVQTVERTDTGRRAQVDNRAAQDLVNNLNQNGDGHWRVVPMDELVPRR